MFFHDLQSVRRIRLKSLALLYCLLKSSAFSLLSITKDLDASSRLMRRILGPRRLKSAFMSATQPRPGSYEKHTKTLLLLTIG
jgi:hypothetical protein